MSNLSSEGILGYRNRT